MSGLGDFGEDFIQASRRLRYQKDSSSRNAPGRARSELGEPVRAYQRSGSFYRQRSGRNSAFQDFRETSSSDEFEPSPPNSLNRYAGRSRRSLLATNEFSEAEVYYFMVIKLKPAQARQILRDDPPPPEFHDMDPVVKAGYLFYYGVYKQHFPYDMDIFIKRFYKEFYKYTCENISDEEALKKICDHTYKEWQRNQRLSQARTLAERRLLNDGRATPDSRGSILSYEDSDSISLDSAAKEPLKFRTPHSIVRFGPGGRLIILTPRDSISTVRIDHLKNHIANRSLRRNIDLIESFKGPLIYGETQPHTLLLFIERQIRDIYTSDVYKGNPDSNDTNDCLLIWRLLQMLIKQQGRITGPDLARLLIDDEGTDETTVFGRSKPPLHAQPSTASTNDESGDLVECTGFLLRGCVDEAINSAIREGCLFDALILAESLYASRPDKLAAMKSRLLSTRSAQHPLSTLISVAEAKPVPLLASTNTGDGRGWRAHIAILLANLQTSVAYESIYRLGLDLAKKEFNSAADFCFLAVNLLSGRNCFVPDVNASDQSRHHINLINATLPDDDVHAARTSYGWSILDFCATEIFEFALRLANGGQPTALSNSPIMSQFRFEYTQLLDALGGFNDNKNAYYQSQPRKTPTQASNAPVDRPTHQQEASYYQPQTQKPSMQPSNAPSDHPTHAQDAPYHQPRKPSLQANTAPSDHQAHGQEASYYQPQAPKQSVQSSNAPSDHPTHAQDAPYYQPRKPSLQASNTPSDHQAHGQEASYYQPQAPKQSMQPSNAPSDQQAHGQDAPYHQPRKPSLQANTAPSDRQAHGQEASYYQSQPQKLSMQPSNAPSDQQAHGQARKPQQPKQQEQQQKGSSNNTGSGWFGGLISKVIPTSGRNEMILPDDKNIPEEQKIRWDPVEGRWIGGAEEEEAPPPPPSFPMASQNSGPAPSQQPPTENVPFTGAGSAEQHNQPVNNASQQQQPPAPSARSGSSIRRGTNRYFNALTVNGTTGTNSAAAPAIVPDIPMAPPTFGFIPMAADDDNETADSPFSQAPVIDPDQQQQQQPIKQEAS